MATHTNNHRTTMELEPARPRLLRHSQSSERTPQPVKQLWLDAWADPVAGLRAFSSCITTCNLCGDGDWRLVVADADQRLKVWKGTQKASELQLQDAPVAVCAFLPDLSAPRLPTLAVAAGPHIYMFRNLRPHFKFTLPPADAHPAEAAAWQGMQAGHVSASAGAQQLQQLQESGVQLEARSLQLLALSADASAQQEFASTSSSSESCSLSCITCMIAIPQAADQPEGVAQLVVGTEDARVLLLTPDGTAASSSVTLPSPPAFLAAAGGADVGCRVAVAARDGRLYSIRGGVLSRSVIQLDSQPVGLACLPKQVVVGTMADALHCYSGSGSKQYTLAMPAAIITLQLLPISGTRSLRCCVVALANGEVRLYNNRALVSVHHSSGGSGSPVSGLYAGRYAREDNSLIHVTAAGGLDIKIMPRSANLEAATAAHSSAGPVPEQDVPLHVPKKTRLYVEQTQREREHAVDMHRVFQRDLAQMRLHTVRALLKVLTDGQGAHASAASLSMSVNIRGLGPRFRLLISLTNEGSELATNLQVLVRPVEQDQYRVHTPHLVVPSLVPLLQYTYKVDVTATAPEAGAGTVRVVVVSGSGHQAAALMTAAVSMPLSEPDDY